MKYPLVILFCMCISLAAAFSQDDANGQKSKDQQKEALSARELIREHEAALKPYRDKMDALARKIENDIKPLREQHEQLLKEMKQEIEPLRVRQDSIARKYQEEIELLADKNPHPVEYQHRMQQLRDTYEPEANRLTVEMNTIENKFTVRTQALEKATERVYKRYESEQKSIQQDIDKINAKYRKQLDAMRDDPQFPASDK